MKNNNILILDEKKCTGCGMCSRICPKGAISMKINSEGFLYPEIDNDKCINCGLCLKKCQNFNNNYKKMIQEPLKKFSGRNINLEDASKSSSGGIFGLMARYVIENNGYVCGAVIDENLNVYHKLSNEIEVINKMLGSKYVQSNIIDCYSEVKEKLDGGNFVLFCGTPCQIYALKGYLNKEYENLICIDLICHGVPSPIFFKKHISLNYGENTEVLRFRNKDKFDSNSYSFLLKKGNKLKRIDAINDSYFSLFIDENSYRESCYLCSFANKNRVGDITLGDSTKKYDSFEYAAVLSLILVNTKKGLLFWEKVCNQIKYVEADFEYELKKNKCLNLPCVRKDIRDSVYLDYFRMSTSEFNKKYKKHIGLKNKIKLVLRKSISLKTKERIKKILER